MANWQRTLDLTDFWEKLKDNEMPLSQGAKLIAERLLAMKPFGDEYLDEQREEIAGEFQLFAEDNGDDAEEFDEYMEALYRWGDIPLDGKWNGKKVCWVATF